MTRSDMIEKAADVLAEARAAKDAETRDSLTRVAQGFATLASLLNA